MNNTIKIALVGIVGLLVGFFLGMQYKAYQVSKAFDEVANELDAVFDEEFPTTSDDITEEEEILVNKSVGDVVEFATMNLKIISSEEKQTLKGGFFEPPVAREGSKFVVVTVEVENITDSTFSFSPSGYDLRDQQGRNYESYDDLIESGEEYLAYRDLSPALKETGVLIYEVPESATSYSIVGGKKGTNETYVIKLK